MNGQWYTWQTALRLVQGYGRSIRSKEDWAETYVLDTGFVDFVNRNSNILPGWFTKAIRSDPTISRESSTAGNKGILRLSKMRESGNIVVNSRNFIERD